MVQLQPYHSTQQIVDFGLIPDDGYQTAVYCHVDSVHTGFTPMLLTYNSGTTKIAIPFLQRPIPESISKSNQYYDGISPYGYAGLISNTTDPQEILHALEEANQFLRENHIVSLFLRMHPLHHQWQLPASAHIHHMQHGKVVYVDLRNDMAAIHANYSNNHKYDIRKLNRLGYTVRINDWTSYPDFIQSYYETMHLHDASSMYFFPESYFTLLRNPELRIHLFTSHDPIGKFASGALFMAYGKTVQYHLGGTNPNYRQISPAKIIFESAFSHFKSLGHERFHLGGGYGSAEDNLYKFKARFSPSHSYFSTIRMICDPELYTTFSAPQLSDSEKHAVDFFPLYRAK